LGGAAARSEGGERRGREERRGRRAARDIAFVVACALVGEWLVLPLFGRSTLAFLTPFVAGCGYMLFSQRARGETARGLGFGLKNFGRALRLLALPTLLSTAFLCACGWLLGGFGPARGETAGRGLAVAFFWLFLWGLLQEYGVQAFINRRAQEVWGRGAKSVLFVALVFALLHAPNVALMLATFLGGLLWSYVYQRAPNLYALALSHALMTVVLVVTLPNSVLHGMRVGFGYFLR
jgi:membrane protease YdiL (CAAX protease family)